jgi:hypothetical protein
MDMAAIYKRGGVWHICYFHSGKRYRYSLETENERAARDELKRIEYELMTGRHQLPRRTPIKEFLTVYLAHLNNNIGPRHYRSRRSMLRLAFGEIIPDLSSQATDGWEPDPLSHRNERILIHVQCLEDMTSTLVARYLDDAKSLRNWAPATYNRAREAFHHMFEYAIRVYEYISRDPRYPNPVKATRRKRLPAPDIRFLHLEEIPVQLDALKRHSILRTAVAIMIYAGLRRGDVVWRSTAD